MGSEHLAGGVSGGEDQWLKGDGSDEDSKLHDQAKEDNAERKRLKKEKKRLKKEKKAKKEAEDLGEEGDPVIGKKRKMRKMADILEEAGETEDLKR